MAKKRQERFEMLRESSKARIEKAALELFAHNGYGHTSISKIAAAAGISKGLMYNYYDSKEALLQAILQKGLDFGDSLLEGLPEDPKALLVFVVEASFQEVINNLEFWKLLTSLTFQEDVLKTFAPQFEQKKKEFIQLGTFTFQQLGHPDPEMQAMLFGAAMDGVFLHYILSPNDYPLEEVKCLLIENFCKKYK
ncbi:MAG TPA: TetR/AcrR family transcriptional regulator [Bacteroidetes bacterium]|nr:TetR/AcrR family transcriptional regulator [Bacteroidota bacterium]